MSVKEMIKRLKRYPDSAEVGIINTGSFIEGDISIDFILHSRKSVRKWNIGDGFEDRFAECDVMIEV